MDLKTIDVTPGPMEVTANTIVHIGPEPIRIEPLLAAVGHASCGATSSFIGTTRDMFQGRKVLRLEYEAYASMAKREMRKICDALRQKWRDIHGVAICHRLGSVAVGEASVLIAVSSPHRKTAIQAVEYAIDTLKATVPIWKKEIFADGSAEWKANCEGCRKAKCPTATEKESQ